MIVRPALIIPALIFSGCDKWNQSTVPNLPIGRFALVQGTVTDLRDGKTVGSFPRLFKIDTQTGKTWHYEFSTLSPANLAEGWVEDASFAESWGPAWKRMTKESQEGKGPK